MRLLDDLRDVERQSQGYLTFRASELPKLAARMRDVAEQLLNLEMSTTGEAAKRSPRPTRAVGKGRGRPRRPSQKAEEVYAILD